MSLANSNSQTQEINEIAVIGGGYVGLVAGACFASFGFDVSIVEVNPTKLALLKKGEVPIYEPGLEEILEDSTAQGNLNYYASTAKLFESKAPQVAFIAVGTPENPDGSCNLEFLNQAVKDVVLATKNDLVLVLKSTVPIGTAKQTKTLVNKLGPIVRIGVVNNPEFLKEGTAVADFLRPERVVLGGTDDWAIERVKGLYYSLLHSGSPLFVCDHETAELAKLSANLMLASRVSMINQISRLATAFDADVKQVENILRTDTRIGGKYLYASLGYGGSCFPKDVRDFIHLCKDKGVDSSLAEAVHNYNDSQKSFFIDDIKKTFNAGATITLLGVAFKARTDDIREAPSLRLTSDLIKAGYKVKAYDPKALAPYKTWLKANDFNVELCQNTKDALDGADAMVLVTEWQDFQRLGLGALPRLFKGKKIYDGKNIFRPEQVKSWGFEYMGVGRS